MCNRKPLLIVFAGLNGSDKHLIVYGKTLIGITKEL